MKVGLILNPIAGGGALVRQRQRIEAALARHFEAWQIRETGRSGEATALARQFAADGCDLVIAAGGDGAASEAADGLLGAAAGGARPPALGILPCGTGTDFARNLGMPRDFEAAIARIAGGTERAIDAGRMSYVDDAGAPASRHFVNIASLGLSGATARAVNRDKRKGKVPAKALFFWRTVVEFMRYRFQEVRITIDDAAPVKARIAMVAVANGRFFGAGMMVAPDAELDDGQFDVVILRAAGKLGLIKDIRLLYGGRHRNHPAITIVRGRRVTVEPVGGLSANAALVDIDGESPGRIPATFEILPGALRLRS